MGKKLKQAAHRNVALTLLNLLKTRRTDTEIAYEGIVQTNNCTLVVYVVPVNPVYLIFCSVECMMAELIHNILKKNRIYIINLPAFFYLKHPVTGGFWSDIRNYEFLISGDKLLVSRNHWFLFWAGKFLLSRNVSLQINNPVSIR